MQPWQEESQFGDLFAEQLTFYAAEPDLESDSPGVYSPFFKW
jgi:hypothetical protein